MKKKKTTLTYICKVADDFRIVWLADVNRYIIFRKPAFDVFRMWVDGIPQNQIAVALGTSYNLPESEALRFAGEVTDHAISVMQADNTIQWPAISIQPAVEENDYTRTRLYRLHGQILRLVFRNRFFEPAIHARVQHLAIEDSTHPADHSLELHYAEGCYQIKSGDSRDSTRYYARYEDFSGAVTLEFLRILHNTPPDSWMGICHASVVAGPAGAVLFTAPSGSGKSTLASLMRAQGYELLADDLVPVALEEPEICQFPAAISVKESAIPVLKDYFPELEEKATAIPVNHPRPQVYLPFPEDIPHGRRARAVAIVMVQYDPGVEYQLTRESNVERMNDFLEQIWVPARPASAGRFLDWYFGVPVYRLRYSDNARAVAGVADLMGK